MQPRISAILGTRDEAELLDPAVTALLRAGVSTVSIMDDGSTDGTAELVRRWERERPGVFAAASPRSLGAGLSLQGLLAFDGPLIGPVIRRDAPDWVMFCDSDEMLLCRGGPAALAAELAAQDVLEIPRYNAVPGPGGIDPATLADPEALLGLPLVVRGQTLDRDRLAADPGARWILHRLPAKLLLRVAAASGFGNSAHNVRPAPERAGQPLRRVRSRVLAMLHLPFTDYPRFRRKVRNIEDFLDRFGDLPPAWGWHWRHWLELDRAGRLAEEFARQCLDAEARAELEAAGVLAPAAAVLAGRLPPEAPPRTDRATGQATGRAAHQTAPPADRSAG